MTAWFRRTIFLSIALCGCQERPSPESNRAPLDAEAIERAQRRLELPVDYAASAQADRWLRELAPLQTPAGGRLFDARQETASAVNPTAAGEAIVEQFHAALANSRAFNATAREIAKDLGVDPKAERYSADEVQRIMRGAVGAPRQWSARRGWRECRPRRRART